jgi:predicted nucleotidyltransferase
VRGARHRERIAETLTVLSEVRDQLVFLGGCVLGLYAAPSGSPLRVTDDVDCFSTVQPWALQLELLARLCADGVLTPDPKQAQRYRVRDTGLVIDVMSPDGMNVPRDAWLRRAADNHRLYPLGDGTEVRAVAPGYFLALKLQAFLGRGDDFVSAKDMEDVVFVAAEVPGLVEDVETFGIRDEIQALWAAAFEKHNLSIADLQDIVDAHIGPQERPRMREVVATLQALATKASG